MQLLTAFVPGVRPSSALRPLKEQLHLAAMAAPSTAAHTGVLVAVLATFVVSAAAHLHHSSVADHRMLAAAMRATRDSSPVHRRMMLDAINGTHRGCGAPEVDAAAAAAFEAEMQAEVQASQNQRTAAAPFSATIRVYFHIIQQGMGQIWSECRRATHSPLNCQTAATSVGSGACLSMLLTLFQQLASKS